MTGGAQFNEVFLTELRISDQDRLGAVNEGWQDLPRNL
jgi:alkylation response protein AidB-like acyl-CoA dehydrogenase